MPTIFCQKCRQSFEPDARIRGPWICPQCGAKNPNLRRHYRSIADLFILGLFLASAGFYFGSREFNLYWILVAADCVLLLLATIAIFRSKTPWANPTVRILIWAAFVIAFLFNVVAPLFRGRLVIAAVVLYALVFP
jgi:FtsH-binding integral membrane protein